MKFFAVFFLVALSTVLVSAGGEGGGPICASGAYNQAQCCSTDVLGVLDIDCQSPSTVPSSIPEFKEICADKGLRARCCTLPAAGQALLCQAPPSG